MIFAIKPFEIHDGDGIRTTIFFKGCPLRCKWCHNPESFSYKKEMMYDAELCVSCMRCTSLCSANKIKDEKHIYVREDCVLCGKCEDICPKEAFEISGKEFDAQEIANTVLRDEMFMKGSGGGVTFSGGEPLMQVDLCVEIARLLKERDINIAVDTSGFVSREALYKMIPYTDTFLFDIKAIDEDVHLFCTGVSNKQILENIKYVDSLGIPMEIRYPYVPTMNDSEAEAIGQFVRALKNVKAVRVLPYHDYARRKYACLGMDYPIDVPVPSKEDIDSAVNRLGSDLVVPY